MFSGRKSRSVNIFSSSRIWDLDGIPPPGSTVQTRRIHPLGQTSQFYPLGIIMTFRVCAILQLERFRHVYSSLFGSRMFGSTLVLHYGSGSCWALPWWSLDESLCCFLMPMALKAEWRAAASWRKRQGILSLPRPRSPALPRRCLAVSSATLLSSPTASPCCSRRASLWKGLPEHFARQCAAGLATWSPRSPPARKAPGCCDSSWSRTSLVPR